MVSWRDVDFFAILSLKKAGYNEKWIDWNDHAKDASLFGYGQYATAVSYELQGDVPNVVFPCAALQDGERVAVYYGAADTVVAMAFGYISEIVEFTKKHSYL